LLFNFALEHHNRRVQVNQNGLKLNGTHQLLVYADDVDILGGRVHIKQKNTETFVVTRKKIGLELNADKTKNVVMSRDQNARRSHNINIDIKPFERMEHFKYLRKILTNQNSFKEGITANCSQGMLAVSRCRIFCRPVC
jgi:PAB1-binding protein PBP1